MPDPHLLLCDTDSLIQLFLTAPHNNNLIPLRSLKDDYGIQPTIVAEVETELMWSRKFGSRFVPQLKKALGNGLFEILDATTLSRHIPGHLAKGVFEACQNLGQQYNRHADRGESYTLAAAVTLGEPALSNDKSALDALDYNGMALPSPVLRLFDLLVFSYQIGVLGEKECDMTRKELVQLREHVPGAFRNASFVKGLAGFCPRILDGAAAPVGSRPAPGPGYAAQVLLARK
jgi:hypothetical protein